MILVMTIILGLGCLAAGLLFHYKNNENFDDVYISSLESSVEEASKAANDANESIDEAALLADILKDEPSKEELLSFTQINQRKDKQIPMVGLPDKSLFHIH